jgi:hypothetical protein
MVGNTLTERYEKTMSRLAQITQAGYQVEVQWEFDIDEGILVAHPELKTHPIVQHEPLNTRDSLYGCRTEAMRLQYKIAEGDTIHYVDVMSLYLYICKYFKFPIGHPVINVGDECIDMQAMLQKDGLMKFSILPPRQLYHPVLPFRCNNRLLFCISRSCAIQQNRTEDCTHETSAERTLTGTWVLNEIHTTVQKVYIIVDVHEVYEYQVKKYNPQTGDGGLFVDYINTFLKLKAEPSDHPNWVQCPEEEGRYMSEFHKSEGIQMDKDCITPNPAMRGLVKICLNSMWAKPTEE